MANTPTYRIVDNRTGNQIGGSFKTRAGAQRRADKLDLEYGAVRFIVQRVDSEPHTQGPKVLRDMFRF